MNAYLLGLIAAAVMAAMSIQLTVVPVHAGPTVVTYCGQTVSGGAVLTADLDCSGSPGPAVIVEGGRLDLAGFTITGDSSPLTPGSMCIDAEVVTCSAPTCSLRGPGTITGGPPALCMSGAVFGFAKVFDVNVSGNAGHGISHAKRIRDSVVSGNGGVGVIVERATAIKRTTIIGNGSRGVHGQTARKVRLSDSDCSGNEGQGVWLDGTIALRSSTVSANASSTAACDAFNAPASLPCVDLASKNSPRLGAGSSCETSGRVDGSGSFGVCSLD